MSHTVALRAKPSGRIAMGGRALPSATLRGQGGRRAQGVGLGLEEGRRQDGGPATNRRHAR
eukprot:2129963-Prymnesium_polylepis.1